MKSCRIVHPETAGVAPRVLGIGAAANRAAHVCVWRLAMERDFGAAIPATVR